MAVKAKGLNTVFKTKGCLTAFYIPYEKCGVQHWIGRHILEDSRICIKVLYH